MPSLFLKVLWSAPEGSSGHCGPPAGSAGSVRGAAQSLRRKRVTVEVPMQNFKTLEPLFANSNLTVYSRIAEMAK